MRLNLNDKIKVKLTDLGKEIYYHQYDKVNEYAGWEVIKPKYPKEDNNGCTEFSLWEFMELYGEHIGMTKPNVIDPLDIIIDPRQNTDCAICKHGGFGDPVCGQCSRRWQDLFETEDEQSD